MSRQKQGKAKGPSQEKVRKNTTKGRNGQDDYMNRSTRIGPEKEPADEKAPDINRDPPNKDDGIISGGTDIDGEKDESPDSKASSLSSYQPRPCWLSLHRQLFWGTEKLPPKIQEWTAFMRTVQTLLDFLGKSFPDLSDRKLVCLLAGFFTEDPGKSDGNAQAKQKNDSSRKGRAWHEWIRNNAIFFFDGSWFMIRDFKAGRGNQPMLPPELEFQVFSHYIHRREQSEGISVKELCKNHKDDIAQELDRFREELVSFCNEKSPQILQDMEALFFKPYFGGKGQEGKKYCGSSSLNNLIGRLKKRLERSCEC